MFFHRFILADHAYFTAFDKIFNNFPEIEVNLPFNFKSKPEIHLNEHSGNQVTDNIFKSIGSIHVINMKKPISTRPFGMFIEN